LADTITITACVDTGSGSCNPSSPGNGGGNSGGGNSGGGGGGGGGGGSPIMPSQESAIFKGLAYPGSIVSLLQNGKIVTEVPASPNGTFQITLYNLAAGTYTFGIRAEDSDRRISTLQTFTVFLAQNVSTQIDGVFIPPTITTDKVEAKRGDPLTIFGKAAPNASVTISIHSDKEIMKKALANSSGAYLYKLDTTELEIGTHEGKARAVTVDDISSFSENVTFNVGSKNVMRTAGSNPSTPANRKCDLNNDNRVNLLDFSIIAYWYKRLGFPLKVDLNTDGKVDLSDVSILAYCWTG
jgi:FtsP/CotA-like multicopper oxidase with cupredoxin domain